MFNSALIFLFALLLAPTFVFADKFDYFITYASNCSTSESPVFGVVTSNPGQSCGANSKSLSCLIVLGTLCSETLDESYFSKGSYTKLLVESGSTKIYTYAKNDACFKSGTDYKKYMCAGSKFSMTSCSDSECKVCSKAEDVAIDNKNSFCLVDGKSSSAVRSDVSFGLVAVASLFGLVYL